MANINIISSASAYRTAIRAIETAGHDCARIDKEMFKVLYINHAFYGKTIGEDFVNHPNDGDYTTALKFKAVLNLVQTGDLWLTIPAARAAQLGLDCPGSWIFCKENISVEEALELVKASKEEADAIHKLWAEIGIAEDGYWYNEYEDQETLFPIPPTKVVIAWLSR